MIKGKKINYSLKKLPELASTYQQKSEKYLWDWILKVFD